MEKGKGTFEEGGFSALPIKEERRDGQPSKVG
jgi:hypothetical protein